MKYYLVNYIQQPKKGTSIYPYMSALYEFPLDTSPKECYEYIHQDLNKNGNTNNEWTDFYCTIYDMKIIH